LHHSNHEQNSTSFPKHSFHYSSNIFEERCLENLPREESGHWYLIPLDKLEEYDTIVFMMGTFDIYDDARWKYEDELDEKFSAYRLSGGVGDLKVLIENKGDN